MANEQKKQKIFTGMRDAIAYAKAANAADDRAIAIVREHERMRVVLQAIKDACERKRLGWFKRAVAELAALGLRRA